MTENIKWRVRKVPINEAIDAGCINEPFGAIADRTGEIFVLTSEPYFDEASQPRETIPRETQVLTAKKGKTKK